jgi:hypothetical protein
MASRETSSIMSSRTTRARRALSSTHRREYSTRPATAANLRLGSRVRFINRRHAISCSEAHVHRVPAARARKQGPPHCCQTPSTIGPPPGPRPAAVIYSGHAETSLTSIMCEGQDRNGVGRARATTVLPLAARYAGPAPPESGQAPDLTAPRKLYAALRRWSTSPKRVQKSARCATAIGQSRSAGFGALCGRPTPSEPVRCATSAAAVAQ